MQLEATMIEDLLSNASVYDLYCISKRIQLVLDDESRIRQIKQSIQVGQVITYFNNRINKLITVTIVEMQIKRVLVEHLDDHSRWWTYYYAININNTELSPVIKPTTGYLFKGNVSIGDIVGFENNGKKIIGSVIKLNPKTVKLITNTQQRWNVNYEYLFAVIDAEQDIISIPTGLK